MNPFKLAIICCACAVLVAGCGDITRDAYEAKSDHFHSAATALRSTTRPPTFQQDNGILPVDLSQTYVGLSPSNMAYIQYRDGEIAGIGFRLEEGSSDRCRHLVHRIETDRAVVVERVSEGGEEQGLCGPIRRTKILDSDWRVEVSGRRLTPFF